MRIQILPADIINKISAGEVIEKPANAIKELVENAIDAGSTYIKIEVERAGRNLIRITDNGVGISKEDLPLTIEKHATSKLNKHDLYDINYLGFRGEALHSIAVTSEMKIASSHNGEGYILDALKKEIKPYHITSGTIVEVRNLFYNVPNKLRFLRSEQTELASIVEIVNKLALINPHIEFEFLSNNGRIFNYKSGAMIQRMEQLRSLGHSFTENVVHIQHAEGEISGEFFLGLPTLTKKKNTCFTFVNRRPVKDGITTSLVKNAYADYIPKDTYPIAVVFIQVPNKEVDVNIHPNKSEIKFQDPNAIRKFIINAIRIGLGRDGTRVSTSVANQALDKFTQLLKEQEKLHNSDPHENITHGTAKKADTLREPSIYTEKENTNLTLDSSDISTQIKRREMVITPSSYNNVFPIISKQKELGRLDEKRPEQDTQLNQQENLFQSQESKADQCDGSVKKNFEKFGTFKCQIHQTFIITETDTEMIIIDQHAAHERILYEKMKSNISNLGQNLLLAEFVPLTEERVELIVSNEEPLKNIGIIAERVSHDAIIVNSVPGSFKDINIPELIEEILQLLSEGIDPKFMLERIYANIACKNAIKASHKLTQEEVEELLTLMENTPNTGQCNHGRPTHIRLPRKEIEKLFLRS